MRHLAANVLTIMVVAAVALGIAVRVAGDRVAAPGPLAADIVVTVPQGAGVARISEILAEAGAIEEPMLFRLAARYSGQAQALKFGEYNLPAGASIEEILAKLTEGDTIEYRVTVAEGLSSWEIVELLRAEAALTGEIEEIPAEGTLAPDTYFIARGDERAAVIARMQAAQASILDEAWARRDPGLPLESPEEALVLASIVEKETGVGEERAQVASVFVNRLNRGMPLQSDPTVIYGITEGRGSLGRGILRSELRQRTAWNTYTIPALPPTPIANPGRAAIEAVLSPADTPYLYFVADGTGGHAFAQTLEEHHANVRVWRRIEAERRAAEGQ
ncbi:MAG: endolytic transglycosylase MltG [Pseudomonadota bacterium]